MCVGSGSECRQHQIKYSCYTWVFRGKGVIEMLSCFHEFPAICARGARFMSYLTDRLVLSTRIWFDLLVQKDAIFILARSSGV